ncbi:MAG: nitrate ABC transporter substrate-binding protein [Burkholderiales bacterium]|nr:MAG: nitrate ABC transporter substrate-binding protein [Burkholderiales bacterium]
MLKKTVIGLAAAVALGTSFAQTLTPIKISYQPSLYWAMPFHVATEKGWWKEVGLAPEFSTFPAGVPQIAASAAKSWDVGGTGSVPAVLGHVRFGIKTIGVTNDESAGNALVASGKKAAEFAKDPVAALRGQTITLTQNSTADYAVQACLKRYGLKKSDVVMKNMGQAEIISAISSNNSDLAGMWAPNIYTVEEKAGAKVLCSGKEGGAVVPGALIARGDYAKENPQNVAKFLAVYLRAWKWMGANQQASIAMMKDFYAKGGVSISEASMKKEFSTRPTFDLNQQIKMMERKNSNSQVDAWFAQIAVFMRETGAVPAIPQVQDFVTDEYMKLVMADPKLREFADNSK